MFLLFAVINASFIVDVVVVKVARIYNFWGHPLPRKYFKMTHDMI